MFTNSIASDFVNKFSESMNIVASQKENKTMATCTCDYFKCAFYWDWKCDESSDNYDFDERKKAIILTNKLFDILHLNKNEYDLCRGDSNFASKGIFWGDTFIMWHPIGIKPSGIKEYFMLEMTGQACRSFELRGGSWLELSNFVAGVEHHMTRFDFALDDINGIIPLENYVDESGNICKGLKSKCNDVEFVSSFRGASGNLKLGRFEFSDEIICCDDDFNTKDIIDTSKGWSVTFGKKDNLQLQIYDKKKERLAKGIHTGCSSWVRFEMRFGSHGDRADSMFYMWCSSLSQGLTGQLGALLLRNLIDFKVMDGKTDRNHYYRLEEWKPYSDFLGVQNQIKLPCNQAKKEVSIYNSVSWIMNQWAKTAVTLCKISPRYMLGVLANSMQRYIDKNEKKHHNSIEGQVRNFFLMFPKTLGVYDEAQSNKGLKDFIDTFKVDENDDCIDEDEQGVFGFRDYYDDESGE